MMETKKIADYAERYGIPTALHCAGSPIGFMANVHCAAAISSFVSLEHHGLDLPFWPSLVTGLAVIHTIPWVISWILRDTIIQTWAPEAMRRRVLSLFNAQEGAGQIIVALIFAPLTDQWGVRPILNISGVLYTVLGIYAVAQRGC